MRSAKFGRFNRVKRVLPRTKLVKQIGARDVARMNSGALIPVPSVHFDVVGHMNSM